jgi:lantibiotic modifying enzyme
LRAMRSTSDRWDADFSLCHGLSGIAEFGMAASSFLNLADSSAVFLEVARSRAERYGDAPKNWPCGLVRGVSPGLMTGLAGIGYFFLRLADPQVPSVLLPGGGNSPSTV